MATSGPNPLSEPVNQLREALSGYARNRKFLVGVSGGIDSMALLFALHDAGFGKLVVCHLNHGLRGREAAKDTALVRKTARELGYDFETARVDCKALAKAGRKSVELAAREARRRFFAECAKKHGCRQVFLAHHADDQVETVLFNFLRGTGAAGLGGMRSESRVGGLKILRPLLEMKRRDILYHVESAGIPYREDASNAELHHTRNRLRHEVIPVLTKAVGEACKDAILRAARILRDENAWMDSQVPETGRELMCRDLQTMPLALQRRTVLRWLTRMGVAEAGYEETRLVLSLLNDGSGPAKVNLPGRRHARRRAGRIFLEQP